jgi:glycosyltransferase involved in cell wall biosynthesis
MTGVSVIIPAFNAASYLADAITSCLQQTAMPQEIIVVDDGSRDDTASIAAQFGAPVRVVRQRNAGEGAARNRGIAEANGKWLAFLDADDLWLPEKLEKQLQTVNSSDLIACHTDFRTIGSRHETIHASRVDSAVRYSLPFLATHSPIMPSSLMVHRSLSSRFPEWANAAVDVMYCLDLVRHGKIECVPEPLMLYRRHAQSMSAGLQFVFRAHECMLRWLDENQCMISPNEYDAIREGYFERLLERAKIARWQRNWEEIRLIREFLARYQHLPAVARFLLRRDWPRWVYYLKDTISFLGRRSPCESVVEGLT